MNKDLHYHKPKAKRKLKRFKPFYLLSIFSILIVWLLIVWASSESQRRFLLPHPVDVAQRFGQMIAKGHLFSHIVVTLLEMGLGLLLGTTLAVLLGYTVAHSTLMAYLLEPAIVISQAIPIVALAPLLTVWFGPGLTSKVVVCSLIVFFPILVSTISGLNNINPQYRALFALLEATPANNLFLLEIPATLPAFLSGLKVGGTLAGMGAVVSEFVASTKGLGYLVKQGQNLYDLPMMFVAIITLMGITTLIYFILTALEKSLLGWLPNS